jgi:hypothetical protein
VGLDGVICFLLRVDSYCFANSASVFQLFQLSCIQIIPVVYYWDSTSIRQYGQLYNLNLVDFFFFNAMDVTQSWFTGDSQFWLLFTNCSLSLQSVRDMQHQLIALYLKKYACFLTLVFESIRWVSDQYAGFLINIISVLFLDLRFYSILLLFNDTVLFISESVYSAE